MPDTVLVTGGSGFVGGWTIAELLKRGYNVRATIRSLDKASHVHEQIAKNTDPGNRLRFVQADLTSDAGWDAAVENCDYVLHVAAPVGVHAPRNPDDLIIPTRDGALRVLRAATRAGVKRVVMTSAVDAARPPMTAPNSVVDETLWTDPKDTKIGPYRLAKTLGERAAWDFMASQSGSTTLATILPGAIIGPVFSADYKGALELSHRMLSGGLPRYPNLGFCVVDVRDVADLHILAMTAPEAAGQRFIASSEWMWMGDIAKTLRSTLGAQAAKVPTKPMPDGVLRVVALFNSEMKFVAPLLHKKHDFTSKKARTLLNWKPRPAATTIVDAARSAIAVGAV